MNATDEDIFVQIAAYRDPECKATVDDLFAKADRPEAVAVGIHWQYAAEDGDRPLYDRPYAGQVRVVETPYREARGACWARSVAQGLYDGERYTLQIDAHMRFVQGWDTILRGLHADLLRAGWAKPVLTHYPPDYTLDGGFGDVVKKMGFFPMAGGMVRFNRTGHVIEPGGPPLLQPWLAAGFHFADAACIREVPYDPHLYFFGEEVSLAVRLWTHGWDLFNPGRIVLYHLYKRIKDRASGEVQRTRAVPEHCTDNAGSTALNRRSFQRVRHLLGMARSTDPEVVRDIGAYGLGPERTLYQYERFSGLRFSDLHRRTHARAGLHFREQVPLGAAHEAEYLAAGEDAAARTYAAHPAAAGRLVRAAQALLGATSVLDLGGACAAAVPDTRAVPGRFCYLPASVSTTRIGELQTALRYATDARPLQLNCVADPLPRADLVACHDLPAHLPVPMVWQLLENLVHSGAAFLAVLRSPAGPDLTAGPYHLPEPLAVIPAGHPGLRYDLWRLPGLHAYVDGMPDATSSKRSMLLAVLEEALAVLEAAMADQPGLLYRLLASIVDPEGSGRRALLRDPRVVARMQADGERGEQAKQLITGLRFRRPNPAVGARCPFLGPDDALWAMVVTCEHVGDFVARRGGQAGGGDDHERSP